MNNLRKVFVGTAGALVLAATAGCNSGGAGAASATKSASTPATTTTVTATSTVTVPSTGHPNTVAASPSSRPSSTGTTRLQTSSAGVPTLGLEGWGTGVPNTRGFGDVRPHVIDNGGDPTGMVQDVTWSNWGGPTADGRGFGYFVPANEPVAGSMRVPAQIRAYDLTTCGGHPAYRHVTWWFPSKGETYKSALAHTTEAYDLCDGR
ncbi:hypothetical protein [Allobranchiibius sp. GilTou73]|uniref:hypothetical protein n=1 Tax=Allobranchiibius sp. GilTou73 TaxID=2904523 RepID=UPI001F2ADB91|nr:hypothetical protein [Allobranchiibius sp. GilTou73]UIJ35377.1 hypothetical protein LVQ62_03025 [Allobranchiibius sp. GilTou73]